MFDSSCIHQICKAHKHDLCCINMNNLDPAIRLSWPCIHMTPLGSGQRTRADVLVKKRQLKATGSGRQVSTAVRPPGDTQHCHLARLPSASPPSFRSGEEEEEGIALCRTTPLISPTIHIGLYIIFINTAAFYCYSHDYQ